MKNIHLIPTDKPSRLYQLKNDILRLDYKLDRGEANKHIYITNSEEIKEGDWFTDNNNSLKRSYKLSHVQFANPKKIILTTDQDLIADGVQAIDDEFLEWFVKNPSCEEVEVSNFISGRYFCTNPIILTEELKPMKLDKYFEVVNNTSDEVKQKVSDMLDKLDLENKQETTLEEAAENFSKNHSIYDSAKDDTEYGFINGAKSDAARDYWFEKFKQQERSYSKKDIKEAYFSAIKSTGEGWNGEYANGNNPNIEEKFKEEFNEWFEQFKKINYGNNL